MLGRRIHGAHSAAGLAAGRLRACARRNIAWSPRNTCMPTRRSARRSSILLWIMLCVNVTAGIGILGKASDMVQDMFGASAAAGSGFVILLSIANMAGRFSGRAPSDSLGRKRTYAIYFGLGMVLYALLPTFARLGNLNLFVLTCVVIMSMYGGAFATIPAYLRDMFGTMHVGAIHGRLLTAWSTAGVLGPGAADQVGRAAESSGVPSPRTRTIRCLYFMAALLLVGLACNAVMSPVHERHHHRDSDAT